MGNNQFSPDNPSKNRDAEKTDKEILELLSRQKLPMRFHEIGKILGFSSGKLQKAIDRLEKQRKIVRKKVPLRSKIDQGKSAGRMEVTMISLSDFESEIIIPVKMNDLTAKIIEKVPEVDKRFESLDELIYAALIYYFKHEISPETKLKAIEKAVSDGLISREKGDVLLGRR